MALDGGPQLRGALREYRQGYTSRGKHSGPVRHSNNGRGGGNKSKIESIQREGQEEKKSCAIHWYKSFFPNRVFGCSARNCAWITIDILITPAYDITW